MYRISYWLLSMPWQTVENWSIESSKILIIPPFFLIYIANNLCEGRGKKRPKPTNCGNMRKTTLS